MTAIDDVRLGNRQRLDGVGYWRIAEGKWNLATTADSKTEGWLQLRIEPIYERCLQKPVIETTFTSTGLSGAIGVQPTIMIIFYPTLQTV